MNKCHPASFGAVLPLCLGAGLLILIFACLAAHSYIRMGALDRQLSSQKTDFEAAQERMFSAGYDSGYRSAIIDAYLLKPQYLISDEGGDVTMWARVEIDPVNKKRVSEASGTTGRSEETEASEISEKQ